LAKEIRQIGDDDEDEYKTEDGGDANLNIKEDNL
jgi:hypothetical protein